MRTRVAPSIAALTVLGFVLMGAGGCDTSAFLAAGNTGQPVCVSAIQAGLQPYGIDLNEMTDKRWRRDAFAREGGGGRTAGYRFYGRPASCASGEIAMSLWPNCGIQQLRTRGDCELPERAR